MRFEQVAIVSLAHVDAPHRVTSAELEERLAPTMQRLGMPRGLIDSLTGIKARRFWAEGVLPSDAATLAGARAIEAARIDRERLGILVNSSVCRDFIEPSVACIVHGNLGLAPTCLNFDVGNACLGFLDAMQVVGTMIEQRQVDYGIIVDGEGSRFVVEKTIERMLLPSCDERSFRDQIATLTLGSGAAAMVLARADLAATGHRFRGIVSLAATEHRGLCQGQLDRMVTDPRALLVAGLALARETWGRAARELDWSADALDECVLHQVSHVHTHELVGALGLHKKKLHTIFTEFGNIGPAAVPITLSKAHEAGRIDVGDRVALMGIGSGLNCSMAELVW